MVMGRSACAPWLPDKGFSRFWVGRAVSSSGFDGGATPTSAQGWLNHAGSSQRAGLLPVFSCLPRRPANLSAAIIRANRVEFASRADAAVREKNLREFPTEGLDFIPIDYIPITPRSREGAI
jgi:hypothetical protein